MLKLVYFEKNNIKTKKLQNIRSFMEKKYMLVTGSGTKITSNKKKRKTRSKKVKI